MRKRYLYIIPLTLALIAIVSNLIGFIYGSAYTKEAFTMSAQWIENGSDAEWAKRVALAIYIFLYAINQAGQDARAIAKHKPIRHGLSLVIRFIFVAVPMFFLHINYLLIIPAAGLFSFVFNQYLNYDRKKAYFYMSSSNFYDWFFLRLIAGKEKYNINQWSGLMKRTFYVKSAVELIAASMFIWL